MTGDISDTSTLLESFLDAIERGDIDAVGDLYADDVQVAYLACRLLPGCSPWAGFNPSHHR